MLIKREREITERLLSAPVSPQVNTPLNLFLFSFWLRIVDKYYKFPIHNAKVHKAIKIKK